MNLFERVKTKKLYYHGTTTRFLNSILSKGLLPNTGEGKWKDDPNASLSQMNRTSVGGIYLSPQIGTAVSAATNAKQELGGERLFVAVLGSPNSFVPDEDNITYSIRSGFSKAISKIMGHYRDESFMGVRGWFDGLPEEYKKAEREFVSILHDELKSSDEQPIKEGLLRSFFQTWIDRQTSYSLKGDDYYAQRDYISSLENAAWKSGWEGSNESLQKVVRNKWETLKKEYEGEEPYWDAKIRDILDRITRYYRKSAIAGGFSDNVREPDKPIDFSGGTRIICVWVPDSETKQNRVVWGEPTEKMKEDWKQFEGPSWAWVYEK